MENDQQTATAYKGSDLQLGMISAGATPTVTMTHKMGLVRLNPTTKSVANKLTYTYNQANGSYTSSTSGSATITASNDFTGNKPYTVSSQYWHIVKATGASVNTAMSFTCNTNQKDYWSAKSSGTDVGYGKYKVIDIQSDRTAANFEALFSYVGTCQTVTLPWYDSYKMECWGAQGGDQARTNYSSGAGTGPDPYGGRGAYVRGQITLPKSKTLYVYVGEQGGYNNTSRIVTFNGGGEGASETGTVDGSGSRGGGATDIRTTKHSGSNGWGGVSSLNTRLIVAGGGGGCTTYGTVSAGDTATGDGSGGAAGGLKGYPGLSTYKSSKQSAYVNKTYTDAQGGSQSAGGAGWQWKGSDPVIWNGSAGGLGYGGSIGSKNNAIREGGGGSGMYGGGSGGVIGSMVSSGAGGSSFISGHPGCATITGYTFTSTKMIDGKGLLWTTAGQTTGGSAERMPTTSGGQEALNTGHTGHGYAKITSQ